MHPDFTLLIISLLSLLPPSVPRRKTNIPSLLLLFFWINQMANNYIITLKIMLISTGVLSVALITKTSIPIIENFVLYEVPILWNFTLSCLRPPYLYLVINCIILTIVASSKLQSKLENSPLPSHETTVLPPVVVSNVPAMQKDFAHNGYNSTESTILPPVTDIPDLADNVVISKVESGYEYDDDVTDVSEKNMIKIDGEDGDDYVISRSEWVPPARQDSLDVVLNSSNEKPPASTRFTRRKPLRPSPEAGKALRVTKTKRQDTLESTWKTITEGRPMPLTRHLRKSDTWETHGRHHNINSPGQENDPQNMKKSETFSERSTNNSSLSPSPGSGKLRREPSLSQDELNRRVEAFIKKFNEEMRLQRQESLNQYHEMISRGEDAAN